jgi:hypothetical protein
MAGHGDAKLTDLLLTLNDCPKARSTSIHNRCRSRYERYEGASMSDRLATTRARQPKAVRDRSVASP